MLKAQPVLGWAALRVEAPGERSENESDRRKILLGSVETIRAAPETAKR